MAEGKPDLRTREGQNYLATQEMCDMMNKQLAHNKQLREDNALRESIVDMVGAMLKSRDERIGALELRIMQLESVPTFQTGGSSIIFSEGETINPLPSEQIVAIVDENEMPIATGVVKKKNSK